jgi:hypothetical protein
MKRIRLKSLTFAIAFLCVVVDFCVCQNHAAVLNTQLNRGTLSSSGPLLVLDNGLVPSAILNSEKEIICVATNWIQHSPLIAQRLDSSGRLLWNTVQVSNPQISGDQNGRVYVLPRSDGEAFFAFEYQEFMGFSGGVTFFASYPHLQLVDRAGSVQWGVDGKRLTDLVVRSQSGASAKLANLAPDGDVVVYWTWFDQDSAGSNVFATYVQKADRFTGDLKYGPTGKRLFTDRASLGISSGSGNVYFAHGGDSIACLDAYSNMLWQFPLLEGVIDDYTIGANSLGEILLLYNTAQGIKGRQYGADGVAQWIDRAVSRAPSRFPFGTKVVNWNDERWVFSSGSVVFCINRSGATCWSDSGIAFPGRVLDFSPVDDSSVVVAFQQARPGDAFNYDLAVQKVNVAGELRWQSAGIKILNLVGTTCRVLADSAGGCYLLFDAMAEYDPVFRPRGTYWQRVRKDGELGVVTAVPYVGSSPGVSAAASVTCYPNPFSDVITIRALTKEDSKSVARRLIVYDILGREVREFRLESLRGGAASVRWDGKDRAGIGVAPGVYFIALVSEGRLIQYSKILRTK